MAHTILSLTSYRQYNMLNRYDTQVQSHDFTLRDLVFVIRVALECVRTAACKESLAEYAELVLMSLEEESINKNPLKRSQSKIVVQMLLAAAVCGYYKQTHQLILRMCWSVLQAQVAANCLFRASFGKVACSEVGDWANQLPKQQVTDETKQMQLQFLRAAICIKLVLDADQKGSNEIQLGLDTELMDRIQGMLSDADEFDLLVKELGLESSFEQMY